MELTIIRGGTLVDPATGTNGLYNVYISGERIASIRPFESDTIDPSPGLTIIEAKGRFVLPGLIDVHTHLREPGYEYKETIQSGAMAGAAGGFTTVLCMANTKPVNDCEAVTRQIIEKAGKAVVNVLPIGALSHGMKGERLTEMHELKSAGCVAISDDGMPVANAGLMRTALEYAGGVNLTVISHAETPELASNGVMNEGAVSTRMGLAGIPNAAEDAMAARDIQLAELTGARLHVAHVSTAGAVALIRSAKGRGAKNITAEATPHHLTLDHEAVGGYNTNAKMNPPLRSMKDVQALRAGIADGTIDCIATDHAPHSTIEKDVEFDKAANGVIGLETAFSLIYGLVLQGAFELDKAIAAMTINPAMAFGLAKGTLRVGSIADITIVNPSRTWTVSPATLKSKSKNTPFIGKELKAVVEKTIVNGKIVYDNPE
ncbi:MAG: dihydroorotase [Deltaproteobacteria bacterium]|nr:dihydroorotase [Deltaproteobacteria bacterium]